MKHGTRQQRGVMKETGKNRWHNTWTWWTQWTRQRLSGHHRSHHSPDNKRAKYYLEDRGLTRTFQALVFYLRFIFLWHKVVNFIVKISALCKLVLKKSLYLVSKFGPTKSCFVLTESYKLSPKHISFLKDTVQTKRKDLFQVWQLLGYSFSCV